MTPEILNFKEALSLLEEISTESSFKYNLISAPPVTLKDLTSLHIKLLYNNLEGDQIFEKVFLDILKDILLDKNLICEELTVLDIISVAIKLRQRMSDEITYVLSEESSLEVTIKISEFLDDINSRLLKAHQAINNKLIKYKDLTLELKVPTMWSYVNRNITEPSEKELESFLLECTKFINRLYFKEKNFKFNDNVPQENLQLLDLLPASLLQNLAFEILEFKNFLTEALTLKIKQNDKDYQILIEVNESLFFTD